MERRTYLAGLGALLTAGCVGTADGNSGRKRSPTESPTPRSIGTRTTGSDDTSTPTETRDPSQKVTVDLTLDNRSERGQTGRLSVTHVLTPSCRYAEMPCGAPTRREVALETSFDVPAGDTRRFGPARMGIEGADDDTVDSYVVEVRSDGTEATLRGLEVGAVSTVGRQEAGEYPWRVTSRRYDVRATLTADGPVRLALESVDVGD